MRRLQKNKNIGAVQMLKYGTLDARERSSCVHAPPIFEIQRSHTSNFIKTLGGPQSPVGVIFVWYSSTVYVVCSSMSFLFYFLSHCRPILSVCCLIANKDYSSVMIFTLTSGHTHHLLPKKCQIFSILLDTVFILLFCLWSNARAVYHCLEAIEWKLFCV